jgi:Rod binding domain-containing protein
MQVGPSDLHVLAQLDGQGLQRLRFTEGADQHQKAAEKFEALFATQLVKELRRALPDGFFGAGPGSDIYNGWLDQTLGESLAQNWKLDLAGMVKTNLDSKQQRLDSNEPEIPGIQR